MLDYVKESDDIIITKQQSMSSFQQNSDSSPKNLLGSNNKLRFPTISNSLLKSAIEANYLEADQKNLIIRNPNVLTVFRMHFDSNSPRTQAAMEMLNIQGDDLQILDYQEFYQRRKEPLHNLIAYLQYITNKYKILNDLLKRRNQIKHIQTQVSKQLNSNNIKYKDESIQLTGEQPESRKNIRVEDIHNSKILSAHQKKEVFDKKINKEAENYNKYFVIIIRFLNLVQDQVNKQEEYYSKTAPEMYQKAEKIKQKQLDTLKKKLKRKNMKVDQVCQKLKNEEEQQMNDHKKVIKELEKDYDLHQQRKQKSLLQSQEELIEQLKRKEEKERERQHKRQLQMSQEQSMIDQVMDSIKKKSEYLNDYLQKKQQEDKKRHQQNLKIFEDKQKKLQESYQQKENQSVQVYVSKSTQRQVYIVVNQIQLNKHEISQIKQQKSLSLKNSRIMKKIEQFQESVDQKRSELVSSKLQETDEKLESGLKRHKSLLDLRKQNLSQKNENRFKLAKQKQMENMLEKIHKQNQILQKNLEITQKNEKMKQEMETLEKYKKEQLQDQVIQRSLMSLKVTI